jgi:acyl-CoA thioester hydrolase
VGVHTYLCRTRWGDIDQFGHVNNVRYVQFVQESLVDLLYQGQMPCSGPLFTQGFLVVNHQVDYKAQLTHSDTPAPISMWVPKIGRSSFDVACELRSGGETVLTARTVVVARNATTGRSRPLNEAERAFLLDHHLPNGPERRPTGHAVDHRAHTHGHTHLLGHRLGHPHEHTGSLTVNHGIGPRAGHS